MSTTDSHEVRVSIPLGSTRIHLSSINDHPSPFLQLAGRMLNFLWKHIEDSERELATIAIAFFRTYWVLRKRVIDHCAFVFDHSSGVRIAYLVILRSAKI